MRIVVAPDAFKGSIPAADAAAALGEGWLSRRTGDHVVKLPMADGGEGTLAAIETATPGARRMPVTVRGPDGRAVAASWLLLPGGAGVVELASTSGFELLAAPMPWDADTSGFGDAIAAALDAGVTRLVLAIGSSASTDGGAGLLAALGARFVGTSRPGARGLRDVVGVDLRMLRPPPSGGAVVLTDVTSPLLGPAGAAAAFGPQKGFGVDELSTVEAGLASFARLLPVDPATPGAGAAGGAGFGLLAWGAELVPGAPEVARLIGLPAAIAGADLVVTGEGAFDASSGRGKAPAHVAALAAASGVPVALVAGRIETDAAGVAHALSLTDLAGSTEAALADPARWLRVAGAALADAAEQHTRRRFDTRADRSEYHTR